MEDFIPKFDVALTFMMLRNDDTLEWVNRGISAGGGQLNPVIQEISKLTHDREAASSTCVATVDFVVPGNEATVLAGGQTFPVESGVQFSLAESGEKSAEIQVDTDHFYGVVNTTFEAIADAFKQKHANDAGFRDFVAYEKAQQLKVELSEVRGSQLRLQNLQSNKEAELNRGKERVVSAEAALQRSESAWATRQERLQSGQSVLHSNDVLALSNARVSIETGSFSREAPRIEFQVHNISQQVLSGLRGTVALYIDGELDSIVDHRFRNSRIGGSRGLNADESDSITIHNTGMRHQQWRTPAVLNANQLAVEIAITNISDDRENRVSFSPQSPEHLQLEARQNALRQVNQSLTQLKAEIDALPENLAQAESDIERLSSELEQLRL
ncbi:MAG: hypothetical protein EA349_14240 [Halomonadaceae bacterium]|nr:MAG: hypothetical protein EA349_14240 [Halomonadaceae bacterium]